MKWESVARGRALREKRHSQNAEADQITVARIVVIRKVLTAVVTCSQYTVNIVAICSLHSMNFVQILVRSGRS